MIKKSWNTQEIEYISANYKDKSLMEIASYLDRTEASVKLKIQRLGYSRNHDAYTEEERKLLSDNYSSMSTKELAKMLGRTENAVGTLARYYGLHKDVTGLNLANEERGSSQKGKLKGYTQLEYDTLCSMYEDGDTSEIAKLLDRSEGVVRQQAFRYGKHKSLEHMIGVKQELSDNIAEFRFEREYAVDENYFENIDTQEKAYFLGLLWADGNVFEDGWSIQITLKGCDESVIERFKKALNSDYPIFTRLIDDNKYRGIYITSKKMVQDLIKHGVVPNKTYCHSIPDIHHEFISSFILGLLDGDGTIIINNKVRAFTFSITNTEETCKWLKDVVSSTLNVGGSLDNVKGKQCWKWSVGGRKQFETLGDWLYSSKVVPMERKYKKWRKYKEDDDIHIKRKYNKFVEFQQDNCVEAQAA